MKRKAFDYLAGAAIALLVAVIAVPQAFATGLSAATYTKIHSVVVKPVGGGKAQNLVYFTITGASGDTYLTSGVTPSATATGLGFTGFVAGTLKCNPRVVGWTSYSTAANLVVLRSTNVQLANATSLNGTVLDCSAIAY